MAPAPIATAEASGPPPAGAPDSLAAAAPAPATMTTVQAEMRLVRTGVEALHAGDPTRALALFDEHARAYPNGVLAEERAGERVLALCDLGRATEARAAAAAFLQAHARAPLAERVRASCAGPVEP
jgi:hypothetical protein